MREVMRTIVPKAVKQRLLSLNTAVSEQEIASVLDSAFYLRSEPDVAEANADAALHFRRFGVLEGRRPHAAFSPDYVYAQSTDRALIDVPSTLAYVRSGMAQRPRLVFVSHDATRTGAPAIILRLLEIFSKSGLFECFTLLDEGGERLHEFAALSHTYLMKASRRKPHSDQEAYEELADLFRADGIFQTNAPICALVNSAESHRIGRTLNSLGVPVVSLIHEVAAYYAPEVFEGIAAHSEKVIFPSNFISRAAESYCDLDMSKTTVRGQGLLEDNFGTMDQAACRRVLRETLGIEEDAFIVLNVGTKDIRKGPDLFVDIAKLLLDGPEPDRPVYFIWHGGQDPEFTYATDFIRRHGLQDRARMLPSTPEIEQVFLGGDLFLLTARADPFPCVIHEAMACGLPVIAFENGGGAPELIGEDCGAVVPLGDLAAVVAALRRYVASPELRAEQGKNARHKIARDWDYHSYCADVYEIIKTSARRPPSGGWGALPAPEPTGHLVIMRGCAEDVALLEAMPWRAAAPAVQVALLDGRFGADADAVIARLQAMKLRYHVCQPSENNEESQVIRMLDLLKNPKPSRVTLINSLSLLPQGLLRQAAFDIEAVQSEDALSDQQLYEKMRYLQRLHLTDPEQVARLRELNPKAEQTVVCIKAAGVAETNG